MESGPDNHYVESAQPSERPPDEQQPLLPSPILHRVMAESTDQHTGASPHQITTEDGASDPTYASVLPRSPNAVQTPPSTEMVSYQDILRFQNQQVS